MKDINENIRLLREEIPPYVKIVAVSKTKSLEDIMMAYEAGHRSFGENRVQELVLKKEKLPGDIEWHMIGHLQSNKVKQVIPCVSMIHSVDSLKLLENISRESEKWQRVTECLLQFHIAREETKSGLSIEEAEEMFSAPGIQNFKGARICGVMGMATYTDDESVIRNEFRELRRYFNILKESFFAGNNSFRELSMGMSGDYRIAIEEGATIVRIGSLIFGSRY